MKWISVEDKFKPRKGEQYIVYDSNCDYWVAEFDGFDFTLNHDYFDEEKITHWMTPPEPPK